jgi:hypothetical protein
MLLAAALQPWAPLYCLLNARFNYVVLPRKSRLSFFVSESLVNLSGYKCNF